VAVSCGAGGGTRSPMLPKHGGSSKHNWASFSSPFAKSSRKVRYCGNALAATKVVVQDFSIISSANVWQSLLRTEVYRT